MTQVVMAASLYNSRRFATHTVRLGLPASATGQAISIPADQAGAMSSK